MRPGQTALLMLIAASVRAQEQVDQPSFRSGVELVHLDVTVLDEQRDTQSAVRNSIAA